MEAILKDVASKLSIDLGMTVNTYLNRTAGVDSTDFQIKACIMKDQRNPFNSRSFCVSLSKAKLNDLCSCYGVNGRATITEYLVNAFKQAIIHNDDPVPVKRKAVEISPTMKTFVGYRCPNCDSQLTVTGKFEMHCLCCDQVFYAK